MGQHVADGVWNPVDLDRRVWLPADEERQSKVRCPTTLIAALSPDVDSLAATAPHRAIVRRPQPAFLLRPPPKRVSTRPSRARTRRRKATIQVHQPPADHSRRSNHPASSRRQHGAGRTACVRRSPARYFGSIARWQWTMPANPAASRGSDRVAIASPSSSVPRRQPLMSAEQRFQALKLELPPRAQARRRL
jgi:hypothetical protein